MPCLFFNRLLDGGLAATKSFEVELTKTTKGCGLRFAEFAKLNPPHVAFVIFAGFCLKFFFVSGCEYRAWHRVKCGNKYLLRNSSKFVVRPPQHPEQVIFIMTVVNS